MSKPCLGTIKSYDARAGHCWGLIFVEGNRRPVPFDFAHCDIERPAAGMKVVFRRRKDRAVDVKLLEKSEPAPDGDGPPSSSTSADVQPASQENADQDGGLPAA